jgi:hypothetical protein
MTTSAVPQIQAQSEEPGNERATVTFVRRLVRIPVARELLIIVAFCLFTATLTWPYVTRLRDAVVDPGDPYLIAWIIWWDFHQTFTDPLNLFHSNVFYPYRYTLAFSEHSYGIAMLFFPLFALGLRPLTVHAIAMFFGFALSGYAAFRLARTLTGSYGIAWVAGIIFAFIPYRFNMMSQLAYLFSPWVPLLFEALVLFVRERSRGRTIWLGVAFLMSGLTTISWFTLSLLPFGLSAAVLLTRYRLWRERAFWLRGAAALGVAALALIPFMAPYYIASKLYGFTRSIEDVKVQSAWPIHWFSVEVRNKFWSSFGSNLHEGWKFKLFPGLLPILLSLAAVLLVEPFKRHRYSGDESPTRKKPLAWLDAFIVFAFVISVFAIGFDGTPALRGVFNYITSERALAALLIACIARLCIAYPALLQIGENSNLIETLRSPRRSDAYWLSLLWVVVGFCYSLGWNFFFYRILYDMLPLFRSMRVVTRGAMIAYLGLAILAGLGVKRIGDLVAERWPRVRPAAVYASACVLLLFELNAAPLKFMRGDVFPDAVTLRLKDTPMRGGIVVLPTGPEFNHRHILRAADHAKPLIVGTSGFVTPYAYQIETLTRQGHISSELIDLLEKIPSSYLVVQTHLVAPERRADYEALVVRGVASGRLRFIQRFDQRDDLYAVTKIEPDSRSEGALPFGMSVGEWSALVADDPVNMLGHYRSWSQRLFRLHVASTGRMPRFGDFIKDVRTLGRGVIKGAEGEDQQLQSNLSQFADTWTKSTAFKAVYSGMTEDQFVDRLLANAGVTLSAAERATLVQALISKAETRARVLLRIVESESFVLKEQNRSLVVLHYFGYLRRNPDDPPDNDLRGMEHWILDLQRNNDPARISRAFADSIEYQQLKRSLAGH